MKPGDEQRIAVLIQLGSGLLTTTGAASLLGGSLRPAISYPVLGRAMAELGVQLIATHSPQAKGRVERLWGTVQDRPVSKLRLASIETLEQANAYLPPLPQARPSMTASATAAFMDGGSTPPFA